MEFCATVQSYGKILMMIERSDGSRGAPTAAGGDGYADGRGEEAKWLRKAKQSLRRRMVETFQARILMWSAAPAGDMGEHSLAVRVRSLLTLREVRHNSTFPTKSRFLPTLT